LGSLDTVKHCSVHGFLTISQCYVHRRQTGCDLECKQCVKIQHSRSYSNHSETRKAHVSLYYIKNRDECNRRNKILYKKNRVQRLIQAKDRYLKLKIEVLKKYSQDVPSCAICGEDKLEFLSIDHINDDGAAHRKKCGKALYLWLRRHNFPTGFQVLCHNHNALKFIQQHVGKSKKALYLAKIKLIVIDHYSNGIMKCDLCNTNDVRMLTIDHIHGGGVKHRREEHIKNMYRYLQKNAYPDGYRVLCFNHNLGLVCRS
jgi:hypothetical protein